MLRISSADIRPCKFSISCLSVKVKFIRELTDGRKLDIRDKRSFCMFTYLLVKKKTSICINLIYFHRNFDNPHVNVVTKKPEFSSKRHFLLNKS